jgi:hypothetical protein
MQTRFSHKNSPVGYRAKLWKEGGKMGRGEVQKRGISEDEL